ncbi:dicarboxylate transporter/tellurite-resistance protein TehA [Proteus columbae]|uniref:dicarboxylate transporter/tellurite-resistance protein TehA n=1 Tax=Proteus columbae TaxID=1987580 RepID=UPI0018C59447|nr:dicarboxylate transporter/tellurite-resistance protein TehA [Proteus columbae]MBG2710621.1 dicarboxylate transporter/tellurite-resistance protein TehA [Proteus mirabilis]MBG2766911.1 dicarboxylate transporter/tellurite-resistance protein TehA [Proteus mirabilis]
MILINKIKTLSSQFASGYFGVVLGMIGTGIAWRYAAKEHNYPSYIGEIFIGVGCLVWLTLTLFLLGKWLFHRHAILDEIKHPVASGFTSLFPATTVLVSIGLSPYSPLFSLVLFSLGAIAQLAYSSWLIGYQWKGEYPKMATTPVLYLPTVANNFICAMACGAFGFNDLGILFFGAGVFSWLSLEPAILNRIRSEGLMDEKSRLSFGIQLAPALVACSAYLAINDNHIDFFAKMLLGYGLLQLLFMVRLIPWFVKQSFSLPFWSFSFGVSALAKASLNMSMASNSHFMQLLSTALFIFANLIILLLIWHSLLWVFRGIKKLCCPSKVF